MSMKLFVSQFALNEALQVASRFINNRSTMPILANVNLIADDDGLTIQATDFERSVSIVVPATVETAGSIALPRVFAEYVGTLRNDSQICIAVNDRTKRAKVSTGSDSANINGMDSMDFPTLATVDEWHVSVDADVLARMAVAVASAAATNQSHPTMTSVNTVLGGGQLRMAATDGYQLARYCVDGIDGEFTANIPAVTYSEVGNLLKGASTVDIAFLQDANGVVNRVAFRIGNTVIVSEIIGNKFPPYEGIIPQKWDTRITVNAKDLQDSIKKAVLFGRDSDHVVTFLVDDDNLIVSARSKEMGDNISDVDCESEGTEGLKISFDSRYLSAAINNMKAGRMVCEFTQPARPGLFYAEGQSVDTQMHVVMPMHPKDSQ